MKAERLELNSRSGAPAWRRIGIYSPELQVSLKLFKRASTSASGGHSLPRHIWALGSIGSHLLARQRVGRLQRRWGRRDAHVVDRDALAAAREVAQDGDPRDVAQDGGDLTVRGVAEVRRGVKGVVGPPGLPRNRPENGPKRPGDAGLRWL